MNIQKAFRTQTDETGQTIVEYGLVLALVVIALVIPFASGALGAALERAIATITGVL